MLKYLSSETDSAHVFNEYQLKLGIHFDSEDCCMNGVGDTSIPMSIIPLIDPNAEGFPEPMGYQGYELGFFRFEIDALVGL